MDASHSRPVVVYLWSSRNGKTTITGWFESALSTDSKVSTSVSETRTPVLTCVAVVGVWTEKREGGREEHKHMYAKDKHTGRRIYTDAT